MVGTLILKILQTVANLLASTPVKGFLIDYDINIYIFFLFFVANSYFLLNLLHIYLKESENCISNHLMNGTKKHYYLSVDYKKNI